MCMKAISPSSYSRFLNALDSLDRMSPGSSLDSLEEKILDHIYLVSVNGQKILVGDIILLKQFGSQATLHGRLKNLVGKGFIELQGEKDDARRKSVHITAKAEKHYQQLSDCLAQALKI